MTKKSRVRDNEHRLRLIRKYFSGFLDRVIRRLQSANIDNPYLEEKMYAEDEYLKVLIDRDNKIFYLEDKYEKKSQEFENEKRLNKEREKDIDNKLMKSNNYNALSKITYNQTASRMMQFIKNQD